MVRVKTVQTKSDRRARGVHIYNPTSKQLERAKEDASRRGFKTVWVHKKRGY